MSFVTKYMNGSIFFSELYTESAVKFVSATFRSLLHDYHKKHNFNKFGIPFLSL